MTEDAVRIMNKVEALLMSRCTDGYPLAYEMMRAVSLQDIVKGLMMGHVFDRLGMIEIPGFEPAWVAYHFPICGEPMYGEKEIVWYDGFVLLHHINIAIYTPVKIVQNNATENIRDDKE